MTGKEKKITVSQELFDQMSTVEAMSLIEPETALQMAKDAKGGTWYSDTYTPYCGARECSVMPRTIKEAYGYRCPSCRNMIGHDYKRLKESPLNYR